MSKAIYNFSYEGKSNRVDLKRGMYLFELWGAQGYCGSYSNNQYACTGAYVRGILSLRKITTFFLFVGRQGIGSSMTIFNGGGSGQHTGGGATDVRLVDGTWNNFDSLKSRIIVAAGGGGVDNDDYGGPGGGLNGYASLKNHGKGATQTSGGNGLVNGTFGSGGGTENLGCSGSSDGNGAGGGGYYGGGCSDVSASYGGGGGSSFISGYKGCDAIAANSTNDKIFHTGQPVHYSGYVFTSSSMIDGKSYMPAPTSNTYEEGHRGDGYIRITFLQDNFCRTANSNLRFSICHSLLFCLFIAK